MRFILPAVAGPVKLVPLEALATEALSARALRKAAERGRHRAIRSEAGTLVSSGQGLDIYLASRFQGLRQPQSREQLAHR